MQDCVDSSLRLIRRLLADKIVLIADGAVAPRDLAEGVAGDRAAVLSPDIAILIPKDACAVRKCAGVVPLSTPTERVLISPN